MSKQEIKTHQNEGSKLLHTQELWVHPQELPKDNLHGENIPLQFLEQTTHKSKQHLISSVFPVGQLETFPSHYRMQKSHMSTLSSGIVGDGPVSWIEALVLSRMCLFQCLLQTHSP